MDGLVYTIDKLGQALASAEERIRQLEDDNAILRQELAKKEEAQRQDDIKTSTKAKKTSTS